MITSVIVEFFYIYRKKCHELAVQSDLVRIHELLIIE